MSENQELQTFTEVALDPKWVLSEVGIGGTKQIILRIFHPRLGVIDAMLFENSARVLHETLSKILAIRP